MRAAPLAASMGDPGGVGPELVVRTFAARTALGLPRFFATGDSGAFARAATRAGLSIRIRTVATAAEAAEAAAAGNELVVVEVPLAQAETLGASDPAAAQAIIGAIDAGVAAVVAGTAAALVTLPIEKAGLYAAGFAFPGHTEYVAHLTRDVAFPGARGPVMLLAGPRLKVALATIHVPLMRVASLLSPENVAHTARVTAEALVRDFGIKAPRIAIAGLNPHAGEGGALGHEDSEIVAPAVATLRAEGLDVRGPISADALFHEEARARSDAIVALYHDQGLIPAKALDFWDTVNVTLGLPIVRTSPDHGVAYDIAGKGVAKIESFVAALRCARAMADARAAAA
jgi:4-hydroxythreonine-4-phosphate dehydrogenase